MNIEIRKCLQAVLGLGLVLAASASSAKAEDRFQVSDKGGFGSTGRFVELPDRFGWQSYEISSDLSLDIDAGALKGGTIDITIHKIDGSAWSYRCKQSRGELTGRVNPMYGQGVSVLAQCQIPPKKFAKAVGMDWDMVGQPVLVFQMLVHEGKAQAGISKGFYILSANHVEGMDMNEYVIPDADPTNLSALFISDTARLAAL